MPEVESRKELNWFPHTYGSSNVVPSMKVIFILINWKLNLALKQIIQSTNKMIKNQQQNSDYKDFLKTVLLQIFKNCRFFLCDINPS